MHSDLLALKIHVDDAGIVWYASASGPPVNTKKTIAAFLLSPMCNEFRRYRFMATHNNVHLILALFLRRLESDEGAIEVCSPLVCSTDAERKNPEHVLYALRQVQRVSSLGGWHVFGKPEYPAYALYSHLAKVGKPDDHARRLIQSHITWPALSFIPHLEIDACCKLMAEILDPRWFLSVKHPTRGSKLRKYLGLDMPTLLGVLDQGPKQKNHDRCKLVLDALAGNNADVRKTHPSYFLHRIREAHSKDKGEVHGTLRMLQTFVEYLRLTWIATMCASDFQAEALFAPEHFFNDEFEVAAWRQHMKKKLGELDG
jgi:hypothetical protein